jgi:hypothetical protein
MLWAGIMKSGRMMIGMLAWGLVTIFRLMALTPSDCFASVTKRLKSSSRADVTGAAAIRQGAHGPHD